MFTTALLSLRLLSEEEKFCERRCQVKLIMLLCRRRKLLCGVTEADLSVCWSWSEYIPILLYILVLIFVFKMTIGTLITLKMKILWKHLRTSCFPQIHFGLRLFFDNFLNFLTVLYSSKIDQRPLHSILRLASPLSCSCCHSYPF